MNRWRALSLIALLLTVALGSGAWIAWTWFLQFEIDRRRYPIQGIDISRHQGRIDWPAVDRAEVDFVYMKASEGGDHRDARFAENWAGATAAGIRRGAYHFFTLCRTGADQARNFIATVPKDAEALPPVVDLEFGGNCARRPSREELLTEVSAFLAPVEAHFGKRPVLYATREFYEAYLAGTLHTYPLWLRSILFNPTYAERDWLFWQYHNRGTRRGISGPVDLNVFRHDRHRLDALQ